MSYYQVLAPKFTLAGRETNPLTRETFPVFAVEFKPVGLIHAPTAEAALQRARLVGHIAPIISLSPATH